MDRVTRRLVLLLSVPFYFLSFPQLALAAEASPNHWTGFYAGINAGVVNHTLTMTDIDAATFNASMQQFANLKPTGGMQLGYRYQIDANRLSVSPLFGVELSANFSHLRFQEDYGSPFALYELNAENILKNVILLQALGGVAIDKMLLLVAAGFSWMNISGQVTTQDTVPFFNEYDLSKKSLGFAVGAAVEYAITQNLSARLKIDMISVNAYIVEDNLGNSYQISNRAVQTAFAINYNFK